MASEFDNEMDFLLRQAAQRTDFAPDSRGESAHLDADELSAFAENALPQSARPALVSHLSDCNSCRQILSNLILLNERALEETAAITESEKNLIAVKPSWLNSFKKIFAFPTLGYATAALAVLLVGSFAFVALRGIQKNDSVSVARLELEQNETQEAKKRASVHAPAAAKDEQVEPKQEEQVPAATPDSNMETLVESSTPTPTENEAKSLPPSLRATLGNSRNTASSNLAAAQRNEVSAANSSNLNSLDNTSATERQLPAPVAGAITQPATSAGETARAAAPKPQEKAKTELRELAKDQEAEMYDDKSDLAGNAPLRAKRRAASASATSDEMNRKVVIETRAVGSKTFQKVGGVWFDSAYSSQNATSITRNSDEYKKLDSGLRSIAENLSGEIIVVWQGKAYRIR